MNWLEKRAREAAEQIYVQKLGLDTDIDEECAAFAPIIEAVAREFAERALNQHIVAGGAIIRSNYEAIAAAEREDAP